MFPLFSGSMLYKCISAQNNLVDFLLNIQAEILSSHKSIFFIFLMLNLFSIIMLSREVKENFFLLSENEENMIKIYNQHYDQYKSLEQEIKSVSKDMKKIKKLQYVK